MIYWELVRDTDRIVHEEVRKSLEGERTKPMLGNELVTIIVNMNLSKYSAAIDFNTRGINKYINQSLKFDYVYSHSITITPRELIYCRLRVRIIYYYIIVYHKIFYYNTVSYIIYI